MTKNQTKNLLIGKFKVEKHPYFVLVDNKYHDKSEMYLQKETLESFIKMRETAEKDGIQLTIISGTRDFYSQKSIWERKYSRYKKEGFSDIEIIKKIMIWSAMPTTSRHHWGTEIDINGFDDYFNGENEKANKEYKWLVNNAPKFDFYQVYTEKGSGKRKNGYNEEKWHWSYMPMSRNYLYQYSTKINYDLLTGFEGSEVARRLRVIPNYVFSINPDCK